MGSGGHGGGLEISSLDSGANAEKREDKRGGGELLLLYVWVSNEMSMCSFSTVAARNKDEAS